MSSTDPNDDETRNKKERSLRARWMSLPFNFLGSLLLFGGLGYGLDKTLKSQKRTFLVGGILLGLAWSLYETFKMVFAASQQDQPKGKQ